MRHPYTGFLLDMHHDFLGKIRPVPFDEHLLENTLNLKELWNAVEQKKKIRRTEWNKGDFWLMREDSFLYTKHGNAVSWKQAIYELNQGRWELYMEPKSTPLLTPDSVGKVVRFKKGTRSLITSYCPEKPVSKWYSHNNFYSEHGIREYVYAGLDCNRDDSFDIEYVY